MRRKLLSIPLLLGLVVLLGTARGTSAAPPPPVGNIVVAPGYKLVKVGSIGPIGPTSIAFGHYGQLYVSSMFTGQISVIPCHGKPRLLLKPFKLQGLMGLAVHPKTGHVYASNSYAIGPNPDTNPNHLRSRISIVHRHTGQVTTFVDDLPSMFFEDLQAPVTGCQGIDFDSAGNLYVAQGINDDSAADGDPFQSAILKITPSGKVSVYASGLRAPYDVRVARESWCRKGYGNALYLYAGDNGEGAEYEVEKPVVDGLTTRQYHDELNRVIKGKHYGWPGGSYLPHHEDDHWYLGKSHIGPLWNLEAIPPNQFYRETTWPVPTGIDSMPGKHGDIVFMAMFNCPSMFVPNLGTIEMFSGFDCSDRKVLASRIDGPIDVRLGPYGHRLYFAEFMTGDIYYMAPYRCWTAKPKK